MSLSEVVLWSLVRCLSVATLAILPARILHAAIQRQHVPGRRRTVLLLAVLPFFVPDLLTGYTWRQWSDRLVQHAAATELLYAGLMLIRATAFGVIILQFTGSSEVHRESRHTWALLRPIMPAIRWQTGRWRLLVNGPLRPLIVAWSLTALVTFQEFDSAALIQVDRSPVAWTVSLFDAHALRQPLMVSLRMAVPAVLCELLLVMPALFLLFGGRHTQPDPAAIAHTSVNGIEGRRLFVNRAADGLWLFAAIVVTVVAPALSHIPLLWREAGVLHEPDFLRSTGQQILTSLTVSVAAAFLALCLAVTVLRCRSTTLLVVALLPGLCGSLVLSLVLLAVFQLPLLRAAYDTWLPLLFGLVWNVLPRSILAVILLERDAHRASVHSAQLLRSAPSHQVRHAGLAIVRRLVHQRWLLAGAVLAFWCFWDVTVTSILRPLVPEPVLTRMYNEMHYGRTGKLTWLALLSTLSLPLIAGVMLAVHHAFQRMQRIRNAR